MTDRAEELEKTIQFNEHTAVVSKQGRDAFLVLCEPKSKEPLKRFVQSAKTDRLEIYAMARKDETLNVGHALTTEQLDFDFDAADPTIIAAFRYFMPYTPYKFGRLSKHDSHWIYVLTEDYYPRIEEFKYIETFLREAYRLGDFKAKIEIRYRTHPDNDFAQRSIAQNPYILAPGSVHPSYNELVTWHSDFNLNFTPVRYDVQTVLKRAILAVIASLIVPHWIEGSRQYMCMALAGSLYKFANVKQVSIMEYASKSVAKMLEQAETPDYIKFTQQDFEFLIDGICNIAGDLEKSDRIKAFKQTWAKAESQDKKITGLPTLKRLLGSDADYIQDTMFHLISGITSELNVQQICDRYVIQLGPGNVIDIQSMDSKNAWVYSRKNFADSHADKYVWWKGKRASLADFVYKSGIIPKVNNIEFMPPEKLDVTYYDNPEEYDKFIENENGVYVNVYKRYAIAPHKEPVTEKELKPFLDYLREVYCNNAQNRYEYLMSFIANLLQAPRIRPKTYLVVVGEQGAGKSFLFEHVLGPILGSWNILFNDRMEDIFGRFNSPLANKMLVVFEEAISSNRKEMSNRLKHFITGKTLMIERKYQEPVELNNFARAVFISNNETNAVTLDFTGKERRAVVFKVSSKYIGDEEYFTNLYNFVTENLDKIHRYLLDYKIANPNILNQAMYTEEKIAMQLQSTIYEAPELNWILDRLEEGYPICEEVHTNWFDAFMFDDREKLAETLRLDRTKWPDTVSAKKLREDMQFHFKQNGVPPHKRNNIKERLSSVLPELQPRARFKVAKSSGASIQTAMPRLSVMPTKAEIIKYLRINYGKLVEARLRKIEDENLEVYEFTKEETKI